MRYHYHETLETSSKFYDTFPLFPVIPYVLVISYEDQRKKIKKKSGIRYEKKRTLEDQ